MLLFGFKDIAELPPHSNVLARAFHPETSCGVWLQFRPRCAGDGSTSHSAAAESSSDCSLWKQRLRRGVWCVWRSHLENHHTRTHFPPLLPLAADQSALLSDALVTSRSARSRCWRAFLPLRSSPHIICTGINGHSPPASISFSPFLSSFPALLPSSFLLCRFHSRAHSQRGTPAECKQDKWKRDMSSISQLHKLFTTTSGGLTGSKTKPHSLFIHHKRRAPKSFNKAV